MRKLTLLGIWNELPLGAWPWFTDKAGQHFYKLSGYHLRSFTYMKDRLHYQYFLSRDAVAIKHHLETLPKQQQLKYVKKICDDYYIQARKTSAFLRKIQNKKFSNLDNNSLIKLIDGWSVFLPLITFQIWFVVLLDIWYPGTNDKQELKKIGAKARNDSGHLHEKAKLIMKKVFIQIAKRISLDANDIYYLFPNELISGLKNKRFLFVFIKKRKRLCVTTNVFGKYLIYEGKKARSLFNGYIPKEKCATGNTLTGLVVSPGITFGKIRIILRDVELKNFKDGEILVAFQTRVHYVPIMKKAKAILTEQGGITSHAAIISRELNKPCIVGIKNCTATLKNGDLVKVDANRGIVKKLS